MDRWRSEVWGAYDPRKGVVLLTHAGCPYICGYIWPGYAGTTSPRPFRGVNFVSPQVDCVRSDRRRIKVSTIRRLMSLSCAVNLRRILPRFSYGMQLKPIDEKNDVDGSTLLNIETLIV